MSDVNYNNMSYCIDISDTFLTEQFQTLASSYSLNKKTIGSYKRELLNLACIISQRLEDSDTVQTILGERYYKLFENEDLKKPINVEEGKRFSFVHYAFFKDITSLFELGKKLYACRNMDLYVQSCYANTGLYSYYSKKLHHMDNKHTKKVAKITSLIYMIISMADYFELKINSFRDFAIVVDSVINDNIFVLEPENNYQAV